MRRCLTLFFTPESIISLYTKRVPEAGPRSVTVLTQNIVRQIDNLMMIDDRIFVNAATLFRAGPTGCFQCFYGKLTSGLRLTV